MFLFFLSSLMIVCNGIFLNVHITLVTVPPNCLHKGEWITSLNENEKMEWDTIVQKTHSDQAIWWLNVFWNELENEAETLWQMVATMIAIESGKEKRYSSRDEWDEKEGHDFGQYQLQRFLKKRGEFPRINFCKKANDLDVDKNGRVALSEYLSSDDKFGKSVRAVINAAHIPLYSSDDFEAEVKDALESAKSALKSAADSEKKAKDALEKAKVDKKAADEAKKVLKSAVADVERHEKARDSKIEKLKANTLNKKLSTMKQNEAKAELAQVEGEDSIPMSYAKREQKKTLKVSRKATKKASESENLALVAVEEARTQKELAETAIVDTTKKLQNLKDSGAPNGQIWWMERELSERTKYLPKGRGRV